MWKKGGIFEKWFSSFTMAVFTQSLHAVMLVFSLKLLQSLMELDGSHEFGTASMNEATDQSTLLSVVAFFCLTCITRFEKAVKDLFGIGTSQHLGDTRSSVHKTMAGIKSVSNMAKNVAKPLGRSLKANKEARGLKKKIDEKIANGELARETKKYKIGSKAGLDKVSRLTGKTKYKKNGYVAPTGNSPKDLATAAAEKINAASAAEEALNSYRNGEAGSVDKKILKRMEAKAKNSRLKANEAYNMLGDSDREKVDRQNSINRLNNKILDAKADIASFEGGGKGAHYLSKAAAEQALEEARAEKDSLSPQKEEKIQPSENTSSQAGGSAVPQGGSNSSENLKDLVIYINNERGGATVSTSGGAAPGKVSVKTKGSSDADDGKMWQKGEDEYGNPIYETTSEKKSRENQALIDKYNAAMKAKRIAIRDTLVNTGATIGGLAFGAGAFDEFGEIATAGSIISEPIVRGSTAVLEHGQNKKIQKFTNKTAYDAGGIEAVQKVKISQQFVNGGDTFDRASDWVRSVEKNMDLKKAQKRAQKAADEFANQEKISVITNVPIEEEVRFEYTQDSSVDTQLENIRRQRDSGLRSVVRKGTNAVDRALRSNDDISRFSGRDSYK